MTLNKLQIRAKILPVLADLKADSRLNFDVFTQKIQDLHEIDDFDSFFEILCKEMSKKNDDKYTDILRAMTIEFIPQNLLYDKSMQILKSPLEPDMLKYQLIQILKATGKNIDYEEFFEYLQDAESIINYDTEKLLEHAVVNPETQIDFLDFLTALQTDDKTLLIDSLAEDYDGNNLANILSPVLYSDFPENILLKTINILAETKSPLAINPIEFLYEITNSDIVRTACKKSLNILKLAGAKKEFADNFYKKIMADTTPYKCYTCIPDGHYNQGFLFSRKRQDGSLMMFSIVVSKLFGIVDSFGFFNLSEQEFDRIILRFSKDEIRFEVPPQYCKSVLQQALCMTKNRKETIPYEFICWSMLLCDINPMSQSEQDWVKENIPVINLNQKIVNLLYSTNYLDKWFFTIQDNEDFKTIIDDFIQQEKLTFEYVENSLNNSFEKLWTPKTENLFIQNIMTTCFLFGYTDFTDYAKILYSVLSNPDLKYKMQSDIIKKSVYEYFYNLKHMHKEFKFPTNIFRRKTEKTKEIDLKTTETIINQIEENWVEKQ